MNAIAQRLKSRVRDGLYRWDLIRFLASGLWSAVHPEIRYRTDHLWLFREELTMGPVQRDEALLLFALTKIQRPQVIVEFGFHYGHSAFNFLQAMPSTSKLYSYDIDETARQIALSRFRRFPNFQFLHKSQADFCVADIGNQLIDLCFLDASHNLEINKVTFRKLEASLAPGAVIVVHDTGTWVKDFFRPIQAELASECRDRWLNENEFQPCKEEREFVNWVLANCPGFSEIHLHSKRTLRNGFTLIQRTQPLPTGPTTLTGLG
jgi:hypothetical protein